MSSTKKSNEFDKESFLQSLVTIIKGVRSIPEQAVRESTMTSVLRLIDLLMSQYADCFEMLKKVEDLYADLSLDSTATLHQVESRLREIFN